MCHNGGCHPGQRATQDWWLMRTTFVGSLSQPCHNADTFITARHSRQRQKAHHRLLYLRTCTSAHAVAGELSTAAAEQSEDKGHWSSESFTITMWLQRGSEARITDAGDVFGLSGSLGRLALLTFCCGNTKRGRAAESILSRLCAHLVGGWPELCQWNGRLGVFTRVPKQTRRNGYQESPF